MTHDGSRGVAGPMDRRQFVQATAAIGAAAGCASFAHRLHADEEPAPPETLVQQLHKSLKEEQKKKICFEFDHKLRGKVDNNWRITDARIGKDLDKDQQELVRQILEHDNGHRGFEKCSLALFGEPGSGKFEFVLTGRHVTRRCDGDRVAGAAFGGPIFYGHAAQGFNEKPTHPDNIYWYQAKRANELFQALDGKQQQQALLDTARDERQTQTVAFRKAGELAGLPYTELSDDQKSLLAKVMEDVLAPFRQADRDESMKLIQGAGMDKLHISYSKNLDVGKDGVWDVWQVEGPAMVWYFRGDPHVHAWVNIRETANG